MPLALLFPFAARRRNGALAVLGAAAVTDIVDGWAARRLGMSTPAGAIADGIADKVFASSVLATLVAQGRLSGTEACVLATRELLELPMAVSVLASPSAADAGRDRRANVAGKVATAAELAAVVAVVMRSKAAPKIVAIAGLCGLAAGVSYWLRELGIFPERRRRKPSRARSRQRVRAVADDVVSSFSEGVAGAP